MYFRGSVILIAGSLRTSQLGEDSFGSLLALLLNDMRVWVVLRILPISKALLIGI
jgi:hypothetical protein